MLDFSQASLDSHVTSYCKWGGGWGRPRRKAETKGKQEQQLSKPSKVQCFLLGNETESIFLLRLSSFPTERERKLKAHADLARPLNVTQHLIDYKETTMGTDGAHKADAELKSKERGTILLLTIRHQGGRADDMAVQMTKKSFTRETSDWTASGWHGRTPQGRFHATGNATHSGFPGVWNRHTRLSQKEISKKSEVVKATEYQKASYTGKAF